LVEIPNKAALLAVFTISCIRLKLKKKLNFMLKIEEVLMKSTVFSPTEGRPIKTL